MTEILVLTGEDRREVADRRHFSWRTVLHGFARSRRREFRRDSDADVAFIDWHHPWLFFLATGTMLLSCGDAFLTLILFDKGMYEANPVMASAMSMPHSYGLDPHDFVQFLLHACLLRNRKSAGRELSRRSFPKSAAYATLPLRRSHAIFPSLSAPAGLTGFL